MLMMFSRFESFGFVSYMVTIVSLTVFSTCLQVVSVTCCNWRGQSLDPWCLPATLFCRLRVVFSFLHFCTSLWLSSQPSCLWFLPSWFDSLVMYPNTIFLCQPAAFLSNRSSLQLSPPGWKPNSSTLDIPADRLGRRWIHSGALHRQRS